MLLRILSSLGCSYSLTVSLPPLPVSFQSIEGQDIPLTSTVSYPQYLGRSRMVTAPCSVSLLCGVCVYYLALSDVNKPHKLHSTQTIVPDQL